MSPQPDDEQLNATYDTLYYPRHQSNEGGTAEFENTPPEVLWQVFRYLRERCGKLEGLKLLDYGCGIGRLCDVARQFGLLPTGVELSAAARAEIAQAGALEVFATLDDLLGANPSATFDLITLWDVIEHLRAPWVDLSALCELLNPGGRLLVSTMNTESFRARLEGPRWENYANPTHLFFFHRRSLASTIAKGGCLVMDEWILPIRYPHHGFIRSWFHRLLTMSSLNSEIVFVATRQPASERCQRTACRPSR